MIINVVVIIIMIIIAAPIYQGLSMCLHWTKHFKAQTALEISLIITPFRDGEVGVQRGHVNVW